MRKCSLFFLLYAAFVGAAFVLRGWMARQGLAEIWGWDYQTFVGQIGDWRWIGYFGFRHPGLGVVCSPLVALQHVWSGAYLLVMPAVATATAWFIWKLSGWVGLVVWLAMPTTWLLAGTPESFPFAQLALVASVWDLAGQRQGQREEADGGGWLLAVGGWCVVNCAITLTNGVKPALGWVVSHWRALDRKVVVRGALAVVGLAVVGVGFFYVRTLMTGRGVGDGLSATLKWIPEERNLPRELYGFFIRPVGLWQSFVIYPLAFLGIYRSIRARHTDSLFLLGSYFSVEAVLHLGIGWGMKEPWVFAPHWIWMLPLLIGSGCDRIRHGERQGLVGGLRVRAEGWHV